MAVLLSYPVEACPITRKLCVSCPFRIRMAHHLSTSNDRKLPVLLFDVMDTIVRDPFYQDVPAFFGMSLGELIACKHPTAWIEFETGSISELELAAKFFKDGRSFDLEGLKTCMKRGFTYIEGVEELLDTLIHNNYEMHAFTNYPIWYKMIEDELKISNYLSWTFCSCRFGKRKPDPEFYLEALEHLQVDPGNCIFVDDRGHEDSWKRGQVIRTLFFSCNAINESSVFRLRNVEAAAEVGILGVHFKNAEMVAQELERLGVSVRRNS